MKEVKNQKQLFNCLLSRVLENIKVLQSVPFTHSVDQLDLLNYCLVNLNAELM